MMKTLVVLICGTLFIIDSSIAQCGTDPISSTTTISAANTIVNSYYPGTGNPTTGSLSLVVGALDGRGSANVLASGDLVIIIQMQGAVYDTTNTNTYGSGVAGPPTSGYLNSGLNAGNYEYNTVASVSGSTITFSYSLANNYYTSAFSASAKQGLQTYQVVRVPRNYNLTVNPGASITCPAWNGSTGGVVTEDAANTLTLNGSVTASALGFRAGGAENFTGATAGNTNGATTLVNTDYRFNSALTYVANKTGGAKGEGFAGTSAYVLLQNATTVTVNAAEGYLGGSMGRGAPGNAGGGATDGQPIGTNQYNSGGGGGGNAGTGGVGGSGWTGGACCVTTYPYGGYGGSSFTQGGITRWVMGGGGGAGSANNSTAANQYQSSGGCGGGIVVLRAVLFAGVGSITADGGIAPGQGAGGATDAAGGGGGGGMIVAVTRATGATGLGSITASAQGGAGGYMHNYYNHGPGGGGGGGYIVTNGIFSSTNISGGANGFTGSTTSSPYSPYTNAWGATSGGSGILVTLVNAPIFVNLNNASSPCGTLPLMLESFSAFLTSNSVLLNWVVEHASNFSQFKIEYSTDCLSFENIGEVPFTAFISKYQFIHFPVTAPANYYRLKMINIDGSFIYSEILTVRQTASARGMMVYPQPAIDHLTISAYSQKSQMIIFALYNSNGGKVIEIQRQANPGNNVFNIYGIQYLPSGIYFLSTSIDQYQLGNEVLISRK